MSATETFDTTRLLQISGELERASAELRANDLEPTRAAELATRCAELASQVAIELDRVARAAPEAAMPGQEELL
jgi:hypothetical protein